MATNDLIYQENYIQISDNIDNHPNLNKVKITSALQA